MAIRTRTRYIPFTLLYFLAVAGAMTLFFELWRLLALLQLREQTVGIPAGIVAESFLVGLRFDFAVSCYIVIPLTVLGILPFVEASRFRWSRRLNATLTIVLSWLAFLICLVDIEFFRFFDARLNAVALEWSDTPGFVASMLWQMFPVIRYFLLYAIICFLFIRVILWLQRRILAQSRLNPRWLDLSWLPVLAVILVFGARGRIEEKAPLTWGVAYFSEYSFPNLLALNPNFTFITDAFFDSGSRKQVERKMATIANPEAAAVTMDMLGVKADSDDDTVTRFHRRVNFTPQNPGKPNVILVLMESFGSVGIGCLQHRFPYDVTPCFDSLAKEGILFTNFYSAGMHTHDGIVGSLYGYPATPEGNIMKELTGQNQFWGLPSVLRDYGYRTMFFCTHDPQFDNMQGFLKSNGMMEVYSLFNYEESEKLSTLGVPDHVMFDHAIEKIKMQSSKPFFANLLTASNHGPWLIPDVPFEHIPESDPVHRQLDAFKYSDWALGRFVRMIQSDSAFANTIILITGDHGSQAKQKYDLEISRFQIPLLVLSTGQRLPRGLRIDRIGSQEDILPTVMGLLRLDYDDYSFGRNLLDTSLVDSHDGGFAVFSEEYSVGYVEDNYYLIWRMGGRRSLHDLGYDSPDLDDSLKSTADLYEKKALSFYQTAYFNLRKPLHPTARLQSQ